MLEPRIKFLNHSIRSDIYQSKIRADINSFLEKFYIIDFGNHEYLNFQEIVKKSIIESFSYTAPAINKNTDGDIIDFDYGYITLITYWDNHKFIFKVNHKFNRK